MNGSDSENIAVSPWKMKGISYNYGFLIKNFKVNIFPDSSVLHPSFLSGSNSADLKN